MSRTWLLVVLLAAGCSRLKGEPGPASAQFPLGVASGEANSNGALLWTNHLGSGEVRLSLSNPFDEKGAEGFRAELTATDRAQDVAVLMQDLLRECNVQSVTTLAEVFPDIDAATRLPMLFRADALEGAADKAIRAVHLH